MAGERSAYRWGAAAEVAWLLPWFFWGALAHVDPAAHTHPPCPQHPPAHITPHPSKRYLPTRLSVLWAQIEADSNSYGLYLQPSATDTATATATPTPPPQRQSGVFRINCVDCLDRTNVVQGVLGRTALEGVLRALGVLAAGEKLPTTLPSVEARFKVLWADHGDDISRQYAGTGECVAAGWLGVSSGGWVVPCAWSCCVHAAKRADRQQPHHHQR